MADVKVQGSERVCLDMLRKSAHDNPVIYNVTIGPSPMKSGFRHTTIGSNAPGKQIVDIYLMWRSSYQEYDNSP